MHEFAYEHVKFGEQKGEVHRLKSGVNYWFYNFIARSIYTIDTRPHVIRISDNPRILNAMLVQFNPDGFEQFIKLHGVGDYSYGSTDGTSASSTDLGTILAGYAYEGITSPHYSTEKLQQKYKFLKILPVSSSGISDGEEYVFPTDSTKTNK